MRMPPLLFNLGLCWAAEVLAAKLAAVCRPPRSLLIESVPSPVCHYTRRVVLRHSSVVMLYISSIHLSCLRYPHERSFFWGVIYPTYVQS